MIEEEVIALFVCDSVPFFTQERPNKCLMNGCNMSFNSVDALQKHMLRHFEHSPNLSPPKKSGISAASPVKPTAASEKESLRSLLCKPCTPPVVPVVRELEEVEVVKVPPERG